MNIRASLGRHRAARHGAVGARPAQAGQAAFAAALWDAEQAPPKGLRSWNGGDTAKRFAVHRNNCIAGLTQALAEGFPVLRRLVGDEFFFAMARLFVCAQPPRSPVLALYGDGLAAWLAGFAPAASLPYLPDMARLEHARTCAFHAADAAPLAAEALARQLASPDGLAGLRFVLHPSLGLVASPWAVLSLWQAHQEPDEAAIAEVDLDQPEAAMLLREGDEVLLRSLPAATAAFVRALEQGQALGPAAAAAGQGPGGEAFDLAATLGLLIQCGAITACLDAGVAT